MASLIVIAVLSGALFWVLTEKSVTGSALAPSSANAGDYEGYGSYEEMMAAHHGGSGGEPSHEGLGGCGGESGSTTTSKPGNKTSYGLTYDNAGYEQLIGYASSIKLSADQKKTITGLNVQMPCCGYAQLDPDNNCGCGHHIASLGLANLLVSKGWSKNAMQTEMNKWIELFYPESGGNMGGC